MNGHFSKLKNWLNENLLLILTFSGVVIGSIKEDFHLNEYHSIQVFLGASPFVNWILMTPLSISSPTRESSS